MPDRWGRSGLGARRGLLLASCLALLAVAVLLATSVFGSDGPRTLSESEAKLLLRQLPYRFEFQSIPTPKGASGAVGGRVFGPHHTMVRFGVSLGRSGEPVSLGPRSDLADATGGWTFRVTDDTSLMVDGKVTLNPRFRTAAQWHEAARMAVDIEEKLCRATEGKPCAI